MPDLNVPRIQNEKDTFLKEKTINYSIRALLLVTSHLIYLNQITSMTMNLARKTRQRKSMQIADLLRTELKRQV